MLTLADMPSANPPPLLVLTLHHRLVSARIILGAMLAASEAMARECQQLRFTAFEQVPTVSAAFPKRWLAHEMRWPAHCGLSGT